MVKAQQWLNQKYPTTEAKKEVKELKIGGGKNQERFCLSLESFSSSSSEPYINGEVAVRFWSHPRTDNVLEGSLSLKGFINLETIDCSFNQLTKLDLSECSKLKELVCHDNKLASLILPNNSWISRLFCWNNQLTELVFPDNSHTAPEIFCQNNRLKKIVFGKDSNLRFINCEKNLLTSLDLSSNSYSILSYVYCRDNQIKELKLPIHHHIQRLDCSNNQLDSLDFLNNFVVRSPESLMASPCGSFTGLKIADNNFSPQNLSVFSRFLYLKDLDISNNPFYGSLKPLGSMTSLWWLNISDTDIDSGLEYLPQADSSFNQLRLVINLESENSRVKKIKEELGAFEGSLQKWKKDWNKKTLEEKMKILEDRLAKKDEEISIFRKLGKSWESGYQNSQKRTDELQTQLSEVKKLNLEVQILAEKNKDDFERQIRELQEISKKLQEENVKLKKDLAEANDKGKLEENLERSLSENEKVIEKQAMQIISLKSQCLDSQIKAEESSKKRLIESGRVIDRREIIKQDKRIQSLRQELKNLRMEIPELQAQTQAPLQGRNW